MDVAPSLFPLGGGGNIHIPQPDMGSVMSAVPSNVVGFTKQAAVQTREEREVALIEAELAPAPEREAMIALKPLFLLPIPKDADEATFVAAFRIVVSAYPLWVIKETVAAFLAGRVRSYSSSYCPNTADFGRELENRVSDARQALGRARRLAEEAGRYAREPVRKPRSPEAAAMGDAMVAKLRAAAEAERQAMRGSRSAGYFQSGLPKD